MEPCVIRGYDGTTKTFETTVPYESTSEASVVHMLECLASRHLANSEIISALLNLNDSGHSRLLNATTSKSDDGTYMISVGENPFYTATVSIGVFNG